MEIQKYDLVLIGQMSISKPSLDYFSGYWKYILQKKLYRIE